MVSEIEHITILTGSSRISRRGECQDAIVDNVRAGLAKDGLIGAGWSVQMHPTHLDRMWIYTLKHEGHPIANCFLCDRQEDSEAIWLMASKLGSLPGTRLHPPMRTPWLAVGLVNAPEIMGAPEMFADVLRECGDIERLVAWAILD